MDQDAINENLIRFWDKAFQIPEDQLAEDEPLGEDDYRALAPSEELLAAAESLGSCRKVLDYGCGNGWAGIIAAKSGCPDVTAVDLGPHIIEAADYYVRLFGARKQVKTQVIAKEWLASIEGGTYDGFICSNVLDIVPLEVATTIIQDMARVVTKEAKIIIGLNYYLSPESAEKRGLKLIEGKYLFMDGVLRLTSLGDEEWANLFAPYFDVSRLQYFAWPGETKPTRRLFTLKRK